MLDKNTEFQILDIYFKSRETVIDRKKIYDITIMIEKGDYSGDMHPVIPVICTQFGG